MPEYIFYMNAVAEAVIQADNQEEAEKILGEMRLSEHDWHDCDVTEVEVAEEDE